MRIRLAIAQDFLDLLSSIEGIFYGDIKNKTITAITTDSRECMEGDIFFALSGNKYDGNDFIPEAIKKGAIPVGKAVKRYGIKVNSGNSALLSFASHYKKKLPNLKHTIAITGSVGKTTTKEMLKILSESTYKTHSTWENFNNEIGLSYTILSSPLDTQVIIAELGMNHMGEIKVLSSALLPDTAIITKLGSAHIGNLGSIENIAKAKLEISNGLKGKLILPSNEPLLSIPYQYIRYFSSNNNDANVSVIENYFSQHELYIDGSLYQIFNLPFHADHINQCLAAAISGALAMGISLEEISKQILKINDTTLRHNMLKSTRGFFILDDSYNASFESVCASLKMLDNIETKSKKHILLGDILELGQLSHDIHYEIGKSIGLFNIDSIFLIGDFINYVAQGAIDSGFEKRKIYINNSVSSPEITASQICKVLKKNDIILAKASHEINLSRIINLIK